MVTNEELVKFYSQQNREAVITNEFIETYQQRFGGYIEVARNIDKLFKFHEKIYGSKYIDNIWDAKGEFISLSFLENEDSSFLEVNVDKKKGQPTQKWHLLISYYLQMELEGNVDWNAPAKILVDNRIICPELWMWMFEMAIDNINITENDVEKFSKMAEEYRNSNEQNKRKEWISKISEIKPKIDKSIENYFFAKEMARNNYS